MVTDIAGTARRRWALRAAIVGLPVATFAILRFDPFLATLKSSSALIRIALLIVVLGGVSRLLRRFVSNSAVQAAVPAVLAVAVLALVVLPYFRNETVVETLPTSAADLGVAVSTTVAPPSPAPALPVTTVAAAPARVAAGALRGIDHRASGEAAVYRLADGAAFVRLEDIDVQNGPDYVLYLIPGIDRRAPGAGVELGALKGNQGSQNYAIPAGIDVRTPHTVLIWCRAFAVPVANASLSPLP